MLSALPPKADITLRTRYVRFVPNSGTSQRHSISAREFGLGLDRKLGPVGSGGSNLMRRLVKAQPNKCARLCRSVQI
jgi:hypothetical protein